MYRNRVRDTVAFPGGEPPGRPVNFDADGDDDEDEKHDEFDHVFPDCGGGRSSAAAALPDYD